MDNSADVVDFLQIPSRAQFEVKNVYRGIPQRCQEYSRYWLTHYPSPSWLVVATALYMKGEREALKDVEKFYYKG